MKQTDIYTEALTCLRSILLLSLIHILCTSRNRINRRKLICLQLNG